MAEEGLDLSALCDPEYEGEILAGKELRQLQDSPRSFCLCLGDFLPEAKPDLSLFLPAWLEGCQPLVCR